MRSLSFTLFACAVSSLAVGQLRSASVRPNDCNSNEIPDREEPDFDGDGIINDCDPDTDNDGVPDEIDVCGLTRPNSGVDTSGRSLGDIDLDCDVDLIDFGLFQQGFSGSGPFDLTGNWDVFYENNLGEMLYEGLQQFRSNGTVTADGFTVLYAYDGKHVEYTYSTGSETVSVSFISSDVMFGTIRKFDWTTPCHAFRR